MILKVDTNVCDECGTCVCVCPADALLLTHELQIDMSKCVLCNNCVNVCPVGALSTN